MKKNLSTLQLVFHYLDDTETKKGFWIYKKNSEGALYFFEPEADGFGNHVARCTLEEVSEGDTFAFIVLELQEEQPDWQHPDGKPRYFTLSRKNLETSELHIYAVPESINPQILYSLPRMIRFYYRREREDYENWKLYVYIRGNFGDTYHFFKDTAHPGWVFARVPVELYGEDPEKIWFKPYRGNWEEEDSRIDRCIQTHDFGNQQCLDVFIRNLDIRVYYERPKIIETRVNVFYHRHDGDYDKWYMNYFSDKQNNAQRHIKGFGLYGGDHDFKKLSFKMDYLEGTQELHYYLRSEDGQADPIDFRRAPLEAHEMNLYMVQDVPTVFSHRKEAEKHLQPRILKAAFHNPENPYHPFHSVWFETNIPLSKEFVAKAANFSIQSTHKKKLKVEKVFYTDTSRRRFGLMVKSPGFSPFTEKYDLKIQDGSTDKSMHFPHTQRISIQRLFDHNDFNERFCYLHENKKMDFGLIYSPEHCQFTLWAPTADQVLLQIYDHATLGTASQQIPMDQGAGLWFVKIEKSEAQSLKGKFYTFCIIENGHATEVPDPYAKACGINALRCAIVDLTESDPPGWKNHDRPQGPLLSPVIYELHLKDMTQGKASGVAPEKQGKYLGLIDKIEYLKRLGINCVQIMPVTKFDTDESKEDGGAYNWGYDQTGLYFVPEGIYATDPYDPLCRVREFKEMVMAFHQQDIRVVIDVVHNHTFETENSLFNKIIDRYYYRTTWDNCFSNGSGCGNELKTERPIVRKLVRDYLKYWVREMGVDGFRFDLMSLTDKYTMEQIRSDIDNIRPYVLLYGEAYKMGWSILPYELQSSKENILHKELEGIGAFTDIGSRNAIAGYHGEPGLASGAKIDSRASHHFYIGQKGEFVDETARNNPTHKVFNYVDIHDDMLLLDYLRLPHHKMGNHEILQRYKLAYSMLFNYIGPIVLKAGVEGLTTKQKDHNSYKTEGVNLINWHRMKKYASVLQYFREYIKFRQSHPAYMMSRHEVNTKLETLDSHNGYVKGKMFKDYANGDPCNKLLIYHNLSKIDLDVGLPYEQDGWALLANDKTAGNTILGEPFAGKLTLPPLTTWVLGDYTSVLRMKTEQEDPLSYLCVRIEK